jgi:hypothetical protein
MENSVKVIGFIELPKLVERGFYFGEWTNDSAYIINKVTGKVVDTVVCDNGIAWTFSGKSLEYYGLEY